MNNRNGGDGGGLLYGDTACVLYAPDGRRWTALKEKEYPFAKESLLYTRLVKKASHPRTDIVFVKALNEGTNFVTGLLGRATDLVARRDPRDPRVCYGDLVFVFASIGEGHFLRATSIVGWCQFSQTKPDIGKSCRGDNVFCIKGPTPDKSGPVSMGDSVVFESAKWPGFYVGTQSAPRGIYCRLTNSVEKASTTIFRLGWSPNQNAGNGLNPFYSTKDIERDAEIERQKQEVIRRQQMNNTAHAAAPAWAVGPESPQRGSIAPNSNPNNTNDNDRGSACSNTNTHSRSNEPGRGAYGKAPPKPPPSRPSHAAPNTRGAYYGHTQASTATSQANTTIHTRASDSPHSVGHDPESRTRTPPTSHNHGSAGSGLGVDDSPFEMSYINDSRRRGSDDAYSRPYDNSMKHTTMYDSPQETSTDGWSEWGDTMKKKGETLKAAVTSKMASNGRTYAQDRYTADPSKVASDMKAAGDNPFLQSVVSKAVKSVMSGPGRP